MPDVNDYDYLLPPELIAQVPLAKRSDSRLLVVDRRNESLTHRHVRDLPELLRPHDCLVLNDTRVVPARLVGRRARTGGRWEGLFLAAEPAGIWKLLCKTRGRLEPNETIVVESPTARAELSLKLVDKLAGGEWLVRPATAETVWATLERYGRIPLPHYIRGGNMAPEDIQRYQTVYALHRGSVAAPTAGLHLTQELLSDLTHVGVRRADVTLHVGVGTFRPITVSRMDEHVMHAEEGELTSAAVDVIQSARSAGGRTIAVGTTTVRVLETAAAGGGLTPWSGRTDLFIRPGFTFRAVDALLTNFHLPRSSLLVLVRAFGTDALIVKAYREAIREQYRVYSYGDAMLIV